MERTSASLLFRSEVLRRHTERGMGETIRIVPLSQVAFAGFLAAVVAVAIGYAGFAGYSRKETVQGLVVPSKGVVRVVAPRPGAITELRVREGDLVDENTVLFRVVSEGTNVSGTGTDAAVLESLRQQTAAVDEQIRSQKAHTEAEIARLQSTIIDLSREVAALGNQLALQARRVVKAKALLDQIVPLAKAGLVTKVELINRQQTLLAEQQSVAALDERMAGRRGEREQAQLALKRLPAEEADRLASLERSLSEIAQRAAEVEGRRRYIVRAPIAGRVSSVQATVGGTTDPRIPQMSIVPTDGTMQAELFVPARAIGFVRRGQRVRLLYDAFPFQRFGTYSGTVEAVASTMLMPSEIPDPVALREPAYRIKVLLDRQSVDAFGREVALQPDMTLTADIILERRSLLAWLLEPIISASRRAA